MSTCTIEECALPGYGRQGWCGRHYNRWVRHGDPLADVQRRATVHEERLDPVAHRYGLTRAEVNQLFSDQDGRCASCGDELVRPCIDHCHDTGQVRGLLCHGCNTGLGLFRDDPDRLERAAAYLRRYNPGKKGKKDLDRS